MNNYQLLEAHNLYVVAEQTNLIAELANAYVKGSVKLPEVHKVLRLTLGLNEFQKIVNYVEKIIADNKFSPMRQAITRSSLFKTTPKEPVKKDLYGKIIKRFGEFHNTDFFKVKKR
jgi:hypothetical protein